jgi:hypothetical protein
MSGTDSKGWSRDLHNGVITTNGKPARVASGMVTKSNREFQLPNHSIPTLEVVASNGRDAGLLRNSKQKFSIHRAMSFLPQE